MNITTSQIQSAINAAEQEASSLLLDKTPVTVTNATLMALIEGAKEAVQARDIEQEMQRRVR